MNVCARSKQGIYIYIYVCVDVLFDAVDISATRVSLYIFNVHRVHNVHNPYKSMLQACTLRVRCAQFEQF